MQLYKHKLINFGLLLSIWTALGQEAVAGSPDSEEREPVVMKVPRPLRKYQLRIGGKEYKPRDETLSVVPYGRGINMYVELLDGNHRTVWSGFRKYTEGALGGITERPFSISTYFGGSYMTGADADKLFADRNMGYYSLSAQWQPALLGLSLSSTQFRSYHCIGASPCGRFDIIANGAALVTEVAPFTGGSPFFQRLHLALHLGASSVRTKFALTEKDVSINDKDVSVGKFANFEFRIPIVRVWLDIQHGWHGIPVELKSLNYRRTIKQDSFSLGVRYAF